MGVETGDHAIEEGGAAAAAAAGGGDAAYDRGGDGLAAIVDGGAGAGGEHGAGWGDQWEWWSAESAASLKAVVEVAREFSLSKISL